MYNIKEIETIASKKTGISSMQIKDILKLLVDDGFVNCEKCGISNIYWSFEYTNIMRMTNEYNKLILQKAKILELTNDLKIQIESLKSERSNPKISRKKLMTQIAKLKNDNTQLEGISNTLLANTPDKINMKMKRLNALQIAIDSIMDNMHIMVNFIADSNPTGMSKSDIRSYFHIPEDL